MNPPQSFGCPFCFQGEAEAMWNALNSFEQLASPVDESHFAVRILACPKCRQRCVKVFTEIIDWTGGDDSIYRSILPLTDSEAERLMKDDAVDEMTIESIDPTRRYLRSDWPSAQRQRARWVQGPLRVGWHD